MGLPELPAVADSRFDSLGEKFLPLALKAVLPEHERLN